MPCFDRRAGAIESRKESLRGVDDEPRHRHDGGSAEAWVEGLSQEPGPCGGGVWSSTVV